LINFIGGGLFKTESFYDEIHSTHRTQKVTKTRFIIYQSFHFNVLTSSHPHVSRQDGGHLVIRPKKPVCHRWDFDIPRAKALMRISMLVGEAMVLALNARGIFVERINFQDNGNWGIDTKHGPTFHMHLYGRARGSIEQTHGEALVFPLRQEFSLQPPRDPLSEDDRSVIYSHIDQLAKDERYQLKCWQLDQD